MGESLGWAAIHAMPAVPVVAFCREGRWLSAAQPSLTLLQLTAQPHRPWGMPRNFSRCLSPSWFQRPRGLLAEQGAAGGPKGLLCSVTLLCSELLLEMGGKSVSLNNPRCFFFLKSKDRLHMGSVVWPYMWWIFSLGIFSGSSRLMWKAPQWWSLVLQQSWQWVHWENGLSARSGQ